MIALTWIAMNQLAYREWVLGLQLRGIGLRRDAGRAGADAGDD